MSFKLCSQVAIGNYAFSGGVNEILIKRSIREIVDSCTIKIPAVGRVNGLAGGVNAVTAILGIAPVNVNNLPDDSIKSSTLWQEGDKVNILLGYNKDYKQEFQGFVRRVNPSIPVLIECEGYAWQLRRKQINGAWKSIKLLDFLNVLIKGTDIVLSPFIPDLPLTNLSINAQKGVNGLIALEYIKNKCHLVAYFQFNILYVGLTYIAPVKANTVDYRIGWNVPRSEKLKYRIASDNPVLVKIVAGKGKNAKRPIVEAGDQGAGVITEKIANIIDPGNLKQIVNRIRLDRQYTGLEGEIKCFLQPFCNPGDTARIVDKMYNVTGGSYFIEGVSIKFGIDGAQRTIQPTIALSTPEFVGLIGNN